MSRRPSPCPAGEGAASFRLCLPRQERRHPWLSLLLDCLARVDADMAETLRLCGRKPACGPGCSSCCRGQVIPLTPLEAAGLRVYAREVMRPAILNLLVEGCRELHPDRSCRFLLRGGCAAYPLRPVPCRRYIVFDSPCGPGEDALAARPEDVLRPPRAALNSALALTLPYYAALGETVPAPEEAFAFCAGRSADLASCSREILLGAVS